MSKCGFICMAPFECYVTLIFWKMDPHQPPRNANNIEHYTFVTLFSRKADTPHPHLCYVTLEWPACPNKWSIWLHYMEEHNLPPPVWKLVHIQVINVRCFLASYELRIKIINIYMGAILGACRPIAACRHIPLMCIPYWIHMIRLFNYQEITGLQLFRKYCYRAFC